MTWLPIWLDNLGELELGIQRRRGEVRSRRLDGVERRPRAGGHGSRVDDGGESLGEGSERAMAVHEIESPKKGSETSQDASYRQYQSTHRSYNTKLYVNRQFTCSRVNTACIQHAPFDSLSVMCEEISRAHGRRAGLHDRRSSELSSNDCLGESYIVEFTCMMVYIVAQMMRLASDQREVTLGPGIV